MPRSQNSCTVTVALLYYPTAGQFPGSRCMQGECEHEPRRGGQGKEHRTLVYGRVPLATEYAASVQSA